MRLNHRVKTRAELLEQVSQALDFDNYPMLRAFDLGNQTQVRDKISQGLAGLYEPGWLDENDSLRMTQAGKEHLQHQVRKSRRVIGHASFEREPQRKKERGPT